MGGQFEAGCVLRPRFVLVRERIVKDGIKNWDKVEMASFAFDGEFMPFKILLSYLNIYQVEAIYPRLLK